MGDPRTRSETRPDEWPIRTGAGHYREAERLLTRAVELPDETWRAFEEQLDRGIVITPVDPAPVVEGMVAAAQAHATLALAAATATHTVIVAVEVEEERVRRDLPRLDEATLQEISAWDETLGGVIDDE